MYLSEHYSYISVDSPAPSCVEGEYLPQFLYPTPLHGELLQARVNHEFEIRVNAVASFSRYLGKGLFGVVFKIKLN